MSRAFERHQAGNHGIVEIEPGRCRAAHGKGRGVQFVVRQQHQRPADQVGGVLVVRRPCLGDLEMKRRRRRRAVQHRRDHQPKDAAAHHGAAVGGAGIGPRIGAGGQRQHGNGTIDRCGMTRGVGDGAHFIRHVRTIIGGKRIDAGDVPQQRRGMFERVGFGEIDAVDAAIDRTVLGDGRNRRIHHRQIGVETFHAARLRRRRPPFLQPADVLRPVAVAARIRRRLRADQAAADIGVERGGRDRELGRGLAGRQIQGSGFFHIDLHNQD